MVKRTPLRNFVHIIQGPQGQARDAQSPLDVFLCFLTEDSIEKIMLHTNSQISLNASKYKVNKSTISSVAKKELKALFGLLIFAAAQKDDHLDTNEMFDVTKSGSVYKAAMSCDRFNFLITCLRFDDKETRAERRIDDKFAPIRELWTSVISNCYNLYKPGSYITIDEQLLAFRGRCPFKMYIPNKPSKYGIKIVMLCDVGTKYMINAEPYLGKSTKTNGQPLADHYVKGLTEVLYGSNRNITMDNWFTSVPLASTLLDKPYNLTVVGTIRKNKKELPPEITTLTGREIGSSRFCFDNEKTLVSYKTKKNKGVILLSTMHEGAIINDQSQKPEIIEFYNRTKCGVDVFDQMCSNMSCSRKTRRWPLCIFYDLLNIITINSWIIHNHNLARKNEKPITRKEFLCQLAQQLIKPWMEERLKLPTLQRSIRSIICDNLKIEEHQEVPMPQETRRTICYYCPSKKRRMTTTFCHHCHRPFCSEHRGNFCHECAKKD